MLKIFNDLQPFFEHNYKRINVREYARIIKISPPSSSKLLNGLEKEGILKREIEKNYIYYLANKDNEVFANLSRIYWFLQFKNAGLIDYLKKQLVNPLIIIFGSFSKAEINENSDIDIAIFTISNKKLNIDNFEKLLKRKIQLFIFKNQEEVKNKDLLNNILNGFIVSGGW